MASVNSIADTEQRRTRATELALKMSEALSRIPDELRPLLSETVEVQCIETPKELVSTILRAIPPEASLAAKIAGKSLAVADGPRGRVVNVLSAAFLESLDRGIVGQVRIYPDLLVVPLENRPRVHILGDIMPDLPRPLRRLATSPTTTFARRTCHTGSSLAQ